LSAGNRFALARLKEQVQVRLDTFVERSHWLCEDCGGIDTFEEGEQGQPNRCGSCRSPRIIYQPAVFQSQLP
jgi:hypothetical protein